MRRFALPAALGALVLGGLAAPAQAAPVEPESFVDVFVPEQVAVLSGTTKTMRAEVTNGGPGVAKDVVLKIGRGRPVSETHPARRLRSHLVPGRRPRSAGPQDDQHRRRRHRWTS